MDNPETQVTLGTQDTGNIGYTKHRTKTYKQKIKIIKKHNTTQKNKK